MPITQKTRHIIQRVHTITTSAVLGEGNDRGTVKRYQRPVQEQESLNVVLQRVIYWVVILGEILVLPPLTTGAGAEGSFITCVCILRDSFPLHQQDHDFRVYNSYLGNKDKHDSRQKGCLSALELVI